MNKIYRVVWNAELGQWVVASEVAKGRKKQSSSKTAVVAIGVVALTCIGGAALAGPAPNSKSIGILGGDNTCLTTTSAPGAGAVLSSDQCNPGGGAEQVGMVAFSSSGTYGAWVNVQDANNISMGAGGAGKLAISNAGLFMYDTLSMSNKTITGLAAGTGDTDAVNVSQLKNAINDGNKYFHANSTGDDSKADGTDSVAIGSKAHSAGAGSIAIGLGAVADSQATGGSNAGDANVALGYNASATSDSSMALGVMSKATAVGATAMARMSEADGYYSTALGGRSKAEADNSVALGAKSYSDRVNTVSVGAAKSFVDADGITQAASTRQIVNMANGTQDHDAVNVSQLKGAVAGLGGGAKVNADGSVSAPAYTVGGKTYNDAGKAFGATDAGLTNLTTTVNNITTGGAGTKYFHANSTLADSSATGTESVAIGGASKAATNAVVIGSNADSSTQAWGTAFGTNTRVTGALGTALGAAASVTGSNSVAIGANTVSAGKRHQAVPGKCDTRCRGDLRRGIGFSVPTSFQR
ncbi:MAG TPA: ESPR-type extended signal peptide-containing protein [Lysobacter sp.]